MGATKLQKDALVSNDGVKAVSAASEIPEIASDKSGKPTSAQNDPCKEQSVYLHMEWVDIRADRDEEMSESTHQGGFIKLKRNFEALLK